MYKPTFAAAWSAAQTIYDASNPGAKVAGLIGGNVARNINIVDSGQRWTNTCAVRMSFILNYSGLSIPKRGQTVSGADQRNYFFRVRDLIAYLKEVWGKAETVAYPPAGGGPLAHKRGVILFEVSGWSDAQGHATLFNGITCYDHCYFNEPEARYRTERAHFWSLA